MSNTNPPEVRIDKWLWAARLYKTRALAAEACRAGGVKIGGKPVKPARLVRLHEVIVARAGGMNRTVKVLDIGERRVGAKAVAALMEDLTPAEELERRREQREQSIWSGAPSQARPTKKQRRQMDRLHGN